MYKWSSFAYILIIIGLVRTQYLAKDERELNRQTVASCISNIARKYFNLRDIITVTIPYAQYKSFLTNSKLQSLLLLMFSQELKWTIITRQAVSTASHINFIKKSHNYIILFDDPYILNDTLIKLHDVAWNPHAKFIIVSNEIYLNVDQIIRVIVESMWRERVVNFIIMLPVSRSDPKIPIYDWFPYEENNCGKNFSNFKVTNYCTYGEFESNIPIFQEKIPNDLHGCPIVVRAVIWPPYIFAPEKLNRSQIGINFTTGIEIKMMNTVAEKCNFTVVYTVSAKIQDWGVLEPIPNASGLFLELFKQRADIGIGALSATVNRYKYLDYSVPYTSESLTWCVPKARHETKWSSIIDIFNIEIWLVVIISYIIVSIFMWLSSFTNQNEKFIYHSYLSCLVVMFQVLFSISVAYKPISNNIRITFIFWALFCLILSAVYQTLLINFLVLPKYEHQIATIQDITDYDLVFSYLHIYRNYFLPFELDKQSLLINKKPYICEDADECLHHIAMYRNMSLAVPRLYLMYKETQFRNSFGKPNLYWFKEDYISFPVQMLCTKGMPLLERIDQIITRVKNAGILAKWEKDQRYVFNKKFTANQTDNAQTQLTLKQLQGIFIIYVIGILLSMLVFVNECILIYFRGKLNYFLFQRKHKSIKFIK